MKSMSSVGIIGGADGVKQLYVGPSSGLIWMAVGLISAIGLITVLIIWCMKKLHP